MAENEQKLRAMLSELHRQLEAAPAVEPEIRDLLERAMDDIHRVLVTTEQDRAGKKVPDHTHESLIGRLGDAARHFEESHPNLAGTVGSVIDALSRMGI